ncbi:hypothetical protein V8E36_006352 [Tilletia maclaganii]
MRREEQPGRMLRGKGRQDARMRGLGRQSNYWHAFAVFPEPVSLPSVLQVATGRAPLSAPAHARSALSQRGRSRTSKLKKRLTIEPDHRTRLRRSIGDSCDRKQAPARPDRQSLHSPRRIRLSFAIRVYQLQQETFVHSKVPVASATSRNTPRANLLIEQRPRASSKRPVTSTNQPASPNESIAIRATPPNASLSAIEDMARRTRSSGPLPEDDRP